MKTVALEKSDLTSCVEQAQRGRVVVLRNRKPVALIVGVQGLDREQLELRSSARFWELIENRRKQPTINRAELEKRLKRSPRRKRS